MFRRRPGLILTVLTWWYISDPCCLATAFYPTHHPPWIASHAETTYGNDHPNLGRYWTTTATTINKTRTIASETSHRPARMVSLRGHAHAISAVTRRRLAGNVRSQESHRYGGGGEIPPDPNTLLHPDQLNERAMELVTWFRNVATAGRTSGSNSSNGTINSTVNANIFCLTGAGLSTDSGIPDYRGFNGSYHAGHKPIVHQMFMESEYQRRRYWGRSMVGWSRFDTATPNRGHSALATLEANGWLGVTMEDQVDFYEEHDRDEFLLSSGQRTLAVLTQNVDSLHQRAGSKNVLQLHGGGRVVRCMNCSHRMARNEYHRQLEDANAEWLAEQMDATGSVETPKNEMRPDGDAQLQQADYSQVQLPACPNCMIGFYKPDVVFFGDTVPKHRVAICQEAVKSCNGILVVGTSLAVHSAYRHIRAASQKGIPIAILNVGETRAEAESLPGIVKIEAPIGETLERCVQSILVG